jgi:hypothetical protein
MWKTLNEDLDGSLFESLNSGNFIKAGCKEK